MSWSNTNDWLVNLSCLDLKSVKVLKVRSYLRRSIRSFIVHYRAEICTVGEMLTLATSHVNNLDNFILVKGIEGTANILNIVRSQSIMTMLSVQTKETNMMSN